MSPAPHPRMHGLTHMPGGPDPIPLPRNLLPGQMGIEEAVRFPGELTHWYRMNPTFTLPSVGSSVTIDGVLVDEAGFFDAGSDLAYTQSAGLLGYLRAPDEFFNAPVGLRETPMYRDTNGQPIFGPVPAMPGEATGWAHYEQGGIPMPDAEQLAAHEQLGSGDNGSTFFTHDQGTGAMGASPGAWFEWVNAGAGASLRSSYKFGTDDPSIQTVSVFAQPWPTGLWMGRVEGGTNPALSGSNSWYSNVCGSWGMDISGSFNRGWTICFYQVMGWAAFEFEPGEVTWQHITTSVRPYFFHKLISTPVPVELSIVGPHITFDVWAHSTSPFPVDDLAPTQFEVRYRPWLPRNWHHIAVTWDGDRFHMYWDGVRVSSSDVVDPDDLAHSDFDDMRIGNAIWDFGAGDRSGLFSGVVDEVATYSKALTLAEIQNIALSNDHGGQSTMGTIALSALDSTTASAGDVPTADGEGGVVWDKPSVTVYGDGV